MEGLLFLESLYSVVRAFENFSGADKSPEETMDLVFRTIERTITESYIVYTPTRSRARAEHVDNTGNRIISKFEMTD